MKTSYKENKSNAKIGRCGRGLWIICVLVFAGVRANAAHELMYAIEINPDDGNLISFFSDAPQTIVSSIPITRLQSGETLKGIDVGANGLVYALGSSSRLYTISPDTGAAAAVGGQFSTLLNGSTFGMDVGPGGVYVTSDLGQSLLINATTANATVQPSPIYAAGDPHAGQAPRIDALAYNTASGTWIAGDSLADSFAAFTPGTGSLNMIGHPSFLFSRYNGLDFSQATGILYFASDDREGDPTSGLYSINPTTGAETRIGLIGPLGDIYLVSGLTVAEIPEPSSLSLLALAGVLFSYRMSFHPPRQRNAQLRLQLDAACSSAWPCCW
jgi:hypothetical protein